jgi:YjbR protein
MTAEEFRQLALSFEGATEGAHHGHPDFRVRGKIFATLGYPDSGWAMARLTPNQQERFVREHPDCFKPVIGAWGRRGATSVSLFVATTPLARRALALAHRNIKAAAPRPHARHHVPAAERPLKRRAS